MVIIDLWMFNPDGKYIITEMDKKLVTSTLEIETLKNNIKKYFDSLKYSKNKYEKNERR